MSAMDQYITLYDYLRVFIVLDFHNWFWFQFYFIYKQSTNVL